MAHRNARLTLHGRRLLIGWRTEGDAGLIDRPSTAHRLPGKTPPDVEAWICALRTALKQGPRRLAALLDVPASTIHAVLTRHRLHRPAWLDRPTGQLIRRYERDRPGELLHVDVNKIGRIRDGGGWRAHGQDRADALPGWLHTYNYHRAHTALGGQPPITRVNNGPDTYS
ncbi:hypothetical protein AB0C12_05860 [Actinoplanes sp. NPDC048967]|uniref:hypothetical protein n=1 Tax=Actinoplanes sp. NPDC048967 TaxID=3155269 RepID=UPI0033DC1E51